jgi:hypothetical protein
LVWALLGKPLAFAPVLSARRPPVPTLQAIQAAQVAQAMLFLNLMFLAPL